MTRRELKLKESAAIADFLAHWADGPLWEMVEEDGDRETPDALLRRRDGTELVGVELTRHVQAGLAKAEAFATQLAAAVQDALARAGVQKVGVLLSFFGGSALAIGVGTRRAANVEAIAAFIGGKLPVRDSIAIDSEELEAADVPAVHGIVMFPTDELFVMKAATTGHGPGVQVIQPTIDEKAKKLATYRAGAQARASRLGPDCRFAGVWLVVTLFDGPGISSSVLTRDAESYLSRRDFDRAFLLDFWEGEGRRVIEIDRDPSPPRRG